MANVGPNFWYVRDNAPTSTVGWSAVTAWAALTVIAAGSLRRQLATPTVNNERVFVCIIGGTTGSSEPTWVITKGGMTAADGSCTWIECTGQPGVNGDTTNSATWAQNASNAVTVGLIIYDSITGSLQIVAIAGTTGSSSPAFSVTGSVATVDGTVTWRSLGAASNFTAWMAPHARLYNVLLVSWAANGNTIFVASDHAETQASAIALPAAGSNSAPISIYCINKTAAFPPTSGAVTTGASISTTGAGQLGLGGYLYINGVTFNQGSGASGSYLIVGGSWMSLVNCKLNLVQSASGYYIQISSSQATFLSNTTVSFANAGQMIRMNAPVSSWENTPNFISGGTIPTVLFNNVGVGKVSIDGCDFSALTSGTLITTADGITTFTRCALASGVTPAAVPANPETQIDFINCDSAATNYQFSRYRYQGTQSSDATVIRTGGATNGVTPVSYNITTTANSGYVSPFQAVPISIYNTVTATNRGVTLYGIWNSTVLPNNDQIWVSVEYLGSATTPLASFANNTKANGLATGAALAADTTSVWNSKATARVNSTVYTAGQRISVAGSNLLFFCTTGGTSAASAPSGYASATDGGSVTDGSAVFQAGFRFSLTLTLTSPQPQQAGYINVAINAALPSSTFWVDPLINLS